MKKLTFYRTNKILKALCKENKKPLERFLEELREDCPRRWTTYEILYLKAIGCFLLKYQFVWEAQDLIQTVGHEILLEQPESTFQLAADLVTYGEEDFTKAAFAALEQSALYHPLSLEEYQILMDAAEKALALGKESVALCAYRAAFVCDSQTVPSTKPSLVVAAEANNKVMAQAYHEAYEEHLKYVRPDGALEKLVILGNPFYVQIALDCNANVHAPTSKGASILELANNNEIRTLLLNHGAQPTDRKIYLLRQAILSIEAGSLNRDVMEELFSKPNPLLTYSFYETSHVTAFKIEWDLPLTAATHRSVAALRYLIPHLQNGCNDVQLEQFLRVLLGLDTLTNAAHGAETAKEIIAVLELLATNNIRITDPWEWDDEHYRMTAGYNSKVAKILDLACSTLHNDSQYPNEELVKIAALLWKVGGIENTMEGARDLLLLGLNQRKMSILQHCLSDLGVNFMLLDTDKTTAAWNAIADHAYEDVKITREYLQFVLENGGDLNHRTESGDTALHAAYRYKNCMGGTPKKLLLKAGANRTIRNNKGERAKDVPQEDDDILTWSSLFDDSTFKE